MEKTKVILANGQVCDATRVPVTSSEERWSEYILEDGSVIRVRIVATEIARLDGMFEPDGTPMYNVKGGPVIAVIAPPELKKTI